MLGACRASLSSASLASHLLPRGAWCSLMSVCVMSLGCRLRAPRHRTASHARYAALATTRARRAQRLDQHRCGLCGACAARAWMRLPYELVYWDLARCWRQLQTQWRVFLRMCVRSSAWRTPRVCRRTHIPRFPSRPRGRDHPGRRGASDHALAIRATVGRLIKAVRADFSDCGQVGKTFPPWQQSWRSDSPWPESG